MRPDNYRELFPVISKSEECKMYRYRKAVGITNPPGRPRSENPSKEALRKRAERVRASCGIGRNETNTNAA